MKNFFSQIKWYYFTRGIGAFVALYELLLDRSSERGTIILAAFGVMGLDYVSRRDRDERKEERKEERDEEKRRRQVEK